jgi:hypothetical protein
MPSDRRLTASVCSTLHAASDDGAKRRRMALPVSCTFPVNLVRRPAGRFHLLCRDTGRAAGIGCSGLIHDSRPGRGATMSRELVREEKAMPGAHMANSGAEARRAAGTAAPSGVVTIFHAPDVHELLRQIGIARRWGNWPFPR